MCAYINHIHKRRGETEFCFLHAEKNDRLQIEIASRPKPHRVAACSN